MCMMKSQTDAGARPTSIVPTIVAPNCSMHCIKLAQSSDAIKYAQSMVKGPSI